MEIELRQVPPDDRAMIRLAEAIKADSDTLVAYAGQEAAGMGALRLLGTGTAEIKRMYVVPDYRAPASPGESSRSWSSARDSTACGRSACSNPGADRWYEKSLA
jgi:hypothetical protein